VSPSVSRPTFRFGDFELDVAAYELRRLGQPVRLERRPMELLMLLVERRDDLVSRADIVKKLWGDDVFVDVDMGVNTAIRKVRQALGDSVDAPTYVTTVPGKGYRFIRDVEDAGRHDATRPTTPERLMIAVLPFENLSADPDREYLAAGLTEEAIAVLGQIDPDRIAVIGRTSVTAYRNTTKALSDIGRELGAHYLVESSIRSEGGRLRITSKLIRAVDQAQVWSATFDNEPDSLLELQRELCRVLATQIHLKLSPLRLDALDGRQTRHAEAYHLYLQGRYFFNQLTPTTTRRALDCYTRATTLDPEYALAWSGLADAYAASPINGDADPRVVTPLARAAADHAVTNNPMLAEAQISVGILHYFLDWNWPKAEAAFQRAIELDPNLAMGHRMLGILLASMTRHEEARAAIRRARELDPLYVMHQSLSSQIAFFARDFDAALHFARQAVVIDSSFWIGYLHLGQALEQTGEIDKALAALDHAGRLSGNSKPISLRGYILARQNRTDDARDVLHTLEAIARERYVPAYAMALVHAGLGERDAAFECLERAFQTGDVHLLFVPADPKWDAFRADARLIALIAKCGFAP
jgi:TolB-like protein/Flp pilus assembly protein TadD